MQTTRKIAFLGYDSSQTSLVEEIRHLGFDVEIHKEPLDDLASFDRVVSFGYRHILKPEVLATARNPAVNLHIAYLPYNRGAHPNFWSWIDGTPSGVTIHEIDAGIDTGPIIERRKLAIDPAGLTFRDTYEILFENMEAVFLECAADILTGRYQATPQSGRGTYHRVADLPKWMTSWDMKITDAKARCRSDR